MGDELQVASSIATIKRAAETIRSSLGQLDVTAPSDEVVSRMQASSSQLEALRQAISDSMLRYQAVRPIALPSNAAHVPEFLRTHKEAHMIEADLAAERRGASAAISTSAHNIAMEHLSRDYDARASALVAAMRTRRADAMAVLARL